MRKYILALSVVCGLAFVAIDTSDEEVLAEIQIVQRNGDIYFKTTYQPMYFNNACEAFMYVTDNPMSFCTEFELEDILLNSIEIDSI